MKVLMQSRSNFYTKPGGDTIQLIKTKEYLEKIGIDVNINLELNKNLKNYDLIHLSNLTRIHETYYQLKNAKIQNKKVVLSTIYWPTDEFEGEGYSKFRKVITNLLGLNFLEKLKAIYRIIFLREITVANVGAIFKNYTEMQRYVIENVDYFLPNSLTEIKKINEVFKKEIKNYIIVPNAIDKNNLNIPLLKEFEVYKDYILCVGRIDARKNQLNLLKAIENTNYKVLLVGAKGNRLYVKKIEKMIKENNNIKWIEKVDNKDLYALYKICKLHILPSWFDTPGLVSLEAAAVGAKIVVSVKGTTEEYFKNFVEYCDPNTPKSIIEAIRRADEKNVDMQLKNHILENFTWDKAANVTLKAYTKILKY